MKAIRITTWAASAVLAAGLTFAQVGSPSCASPRSGNGEQAASQSNLLCKQTRSRGGKAQGKGQQKRGGARDGSGDGCKDGTLAKGGKGKGGGTRKRDGSCQVVA